MEASLRDFWLPPQFKLDMRSFGILNSVEWYFVIDVSGHVSIPSSSVVQSKNILLEMLDP